MVSKNKIWSDEKVTDYSMNQNIYQPLSGFDSTDNTVATASASGSGDDSGWVQARTLAVSANGITKDVIIKGDFDAVSYDAGTSNTVTASVQITIDGTQKFTKSITNTWTTSTGTDPQSGESYCRGFCFKYTPSAGEISAGFTIDLDIKVVNGEANASAKGKCNNYFWEVWGA